MSERLYLLNVTEKTFVCIAKGDSIGFQMGNLEFSQKLLSRLSTKDEMAIRFEGDFSTDGYTNLNTKNKWDYYSIPVESEDENEN